MAINSPFRTLQADNIEGVNVARNYVKSSFENGSTVGWSLFNTTLTSGLPTGTVGAGASSLALSTTSTNPLSESFSLNLTSSAVTAGQGIISDVFTIDRADQASVLTSLFNYEVIAGSANLTASGVLGSQTVISYIYDVTNGVWIQPTGVTGMTSISGPSQCAPITFQTAALGSGNQYRLAVLFTQATASTTTINFDNFRCSKITAPTGAVITDWVRYAPANQNLGTLVQPEFEWRRVGDSIEINGAFTSGSVTSGDMAIGLPSGLVSASTTKIPTQYVCGYGNYNVATPNQIAPLIFPNSSFINFGVQNSTTAGTTKLNAASFGGGTGMEFFAEIPIAGWSSNVQTSNDTDTRVISFTGGQTSQAVTANVTDIAFTTLVDRSGSWNGTQFKVPVAGDYVVSPSFVVSASSGVTGVVFLNGSAYNGGLLSTTSGTGTVTAGSILVTNCKAGDLLSVRANASTTVSVGQIGIFRLSGPAVIAATESVNARYTNTSGFSIPNNTVTTITGWTKDYDTHNFVSTGGVATIPIPGKYRISASLYITSGAIAIATEYEILALQAGSQTRTVYLDGAYGEASATAPVAMSGSDTLLCLAGDTISISGYQNSGGARTLQTTAGQVHWQIERVGN